MVKRKITAELAVIFSKWWTQRDSNPRPLGCEPNALPAELWAHIAAFLRGFCNKKQIFKFFDFRRFRRKITPKSWAETHRSMCDHRDANRTLSQLSYRPKKILKYLSADYHNTLFQFVNPLFHFSVDIFSEI